MATMLFVIEKAVNIRLNKFNMGYGFGSGTGIGHGKNEKRRVFVRKGALFVLAHWFQKT